MKTASGEMVISNGQVVDGNGGAPVRDGAVVVKDGRITYVGPKAGAPAVGTDAVKIDAQGGRSCRGWWKRIFMRRISTWRRWRIWISSIRWSM